MLSKQKQHEAKILFKLAIPLLLSLLAQHAMSACGHLITKWYDDAHFCALTWAGELWNPFYLFAYGIFATFTPMLAIFRQSRQQAEMKHCLWQLIWLSLFISLGIGTLLIFSNCALDRMFHLDQSSCPFSVLEVSQVRRSYLRYLSYSCPIYFLFLALKILPESLSNTTLGMKLSFFGLGLNIPLNYCLIYGRWGFPELGGPGAGVATTLAYLAMLLGLILTLYWNRNDYYRECGFDLFHWEGPKLQTLFKQFCQGSVKGLSLFLESTVFLLITCLLTRFGGNVLHGHQVVYEIYVSFYLIPCAFGTAVSVRSGSLIGASDSQALRTCIQASLQVGMMIGLVNGIILLSTRRALLAIFQLNPPMLELAMHALMLSAACQWVDSIQIVAESILRAYQAFKFLFLVNIATYWVITLPIIYGLLCHAQPHGEYWVIQSIWVGLIAGFLVASIVLLGRIYQLSTNPKTPSILPTSAR